MTKFITMFFVVLLFSTNTSAKTCYTNNANKQIKEHLSAYKKMLAEKRKNPVCYSAEKNRAIKAALAELKGARKKIVVRDIAIKKMEKKIKEFLRREGQRRTKIAVLEKEVSLLSKNKKNAATKLKNTMIIGGIVIGVAVIVGGVIAVSNAFSSVVIK